MLALGARVLADGVGFGRLVGAGTSTRCRGCIGTAGVVAAHGRTGANLYYPVMARMVTARNIVGRFTNRPYGCIWHGPPVWTDAL